MADDSDDEIYVDVIPRLDQAAADDVVGQIQDKFSDVSANLGKGIVESLGDATGTLAGQLANHARSIGDSLREEISGSITDAGDRFGSILGGGLSDILTGHAPDFSGMGGVFGDLFDTDAVHGLRNEWDQLGGAFKDIGGGDIFGGIGSLKDTLNGMNIDALNGVFDKIESISSITGALNDGNPLGALSSALTMLGHSNVSDGLAQVQDILSNRGSGGLVDDLHSVSQLLDVGGDMSRSFGNGRVGSKFDRAAAAIDSGADIADVVGRVHGHLTDRGAILPSIMQGMQAGAQFGNSILPGVGGLIGGLGGGFVTSVAGATAPDISSRDVSINPQISGYSQQVADYAAGLGGDVGESAVLGMHPHGPLPAAVGRGGGIPGVHTYDDNQTIGGGAAYGPASTIVAPTLLPSISGGGAPSSVTTQEMDVRAGVVNLGGAINIPGLSVSAPASVGGGSAAGTSGAAGASRGAGAGHPSAPTSHSAAGDAGRIPGHAAGGYATDGILPGETPGYDNLLGMLPDGKIFGLEGGEGIVRPEASSNPIVRQIIEGWNNGTGLPGFSGGGTLPEGPLLDGPGTQPPSQVGGTPGPGNKGQQGQQDGQLGPHGTGQGFGISGGVLGTAESAAAMAASMTPAGPAGGAAVQAASQEMNRTFGYFGQLAGILGIEMPLDTLSIHGGKLADMGKSWLGKVGLGMAGAHHDTPNTAGQTTPPIPPTQPPAAVPADDHPIVGGAPNQSRTPGVHIENMHVNNNNGGSDVEQSMLRATGMQYNLGPA